MYAKYRFAFTRTNRNKSEQRQTVVGEQSLLFNRVYVLTRSECVLYLRQLHKQSIFLHSYSRTQHVHIIKRPWRYCESEKPYGRKTTAMADLTFCAAVIASTHNIVICI